MMKPISDMTIDELRAELEATRRNLENVALLLEEATARGKAARKLAKEAMRANNIEGAHVVVRAGPEGFRLVICAPPEENEHHLAEGIALWLRKMYGNVQMGEPKGNVGVSES